MPDFPSDCISDFGVAGLRALGLALHWIPPTFGAGAGRTNVAAQFS